MIADSTAALVEGGAFPGDFIEAEFRRLRLRLRRRIAWLRRQWQGDALGESRGLAIGDRRADALLRDTRSVEQRFYREDPEASGLTREIERLERDLAVRSHALGEAGDPPRIDSLATLFALTRFERDVILLCLAQELDPSFGTLYGYVQDDARRRYATPHLAMDLFGEIPGASLDAFLAHAPLQSFSLLSADGRDPAAGALHGARPLVLEPRVVAFLRGDDQVDGGIATHLELLPQGPLASSHAELVDRLCRVLREGTGPNLPAVNLVGPPDAGKAVLAAALCRTLGFRPATLSLERLPSSPSDRRGVLRELEREAILTRLAVYVAFEDSGRVAVDSLSDVFEGFRGLVIVGSRKPLACARTLIVLPVEKPSPAEQRTLWHGVLGEAGVRLDDAIRALVEHFDFGPEAIARSAAAARDANRIRGDPHGVVTADDLWSACRRQPSWSLGHLAHRIVPSYDWSDIVLPRDTHSQLLEIADQVTHRFRVYEEWGFGRKLSRGRGISALFSGPSGTGKTMAAEILANHLRLDLYRVDLSAIMSKYIGETEKNLALVFEGAERCGAILFFDEADALFGKRTEVRDSHDRYANIEVDYLLQRMEDYRGLAILATNRKSDLDRALLRRIRFLVEFPFPDGPSRGRIWQKAFPPQARVERLDFGRLSRFEISGGNIRNIALNAAFLAASEGVSVGMSHIIRAARREYEKIDKLPTEDEFRRPDGEGPP